MDLIIFPLIGLGVTGLLIAVVQITGTIVIQGFPPKVIRRSQQPAAFRNWMGALWFALALFAALGVIAYLASN